MRTRNEYVTALRCRRRSGRANRAFTLIELLLVLVILASLAAIVTPNLTRHSETARRTRAQTDIATLDMALDTFQINVGRYPTESEGLAALIEQPTASDADGWDGPYIKKHGVPLDPWGNPYVYKQPGRYNTDSYDLYSYGKDKKDGGDDDIVNWSEEL